MFTGLSAMQFGPDVMSLGDAHSSERVFASLVSGNYFEVVGTRPAAGRFFVPDEDRTLGHASGDRSQPRLLDAAASAGAQ